MSLAVFGKLAGQELERVRAERAANDPTQRKLLADAREDFEKFCSLVHIVTKAGKREPLRFNAIQRLFHIRRTGRDIALKPRQIGFTTLELARDLWTFLCRDGARVVVVCQSTADNGPAKLLSNVLRTMIEGLKSNGWPIRFSTEAWNEWVLPNGNTLRITQAGASEASAEKKGRGGTITRLHLTETAFYDHAKKTLNSLFECVPGPETGSEIVNESTANGAAGLFYDQCKSAEAHKSQHTLHFFAWFDHPEYRTALDPGEDVTPRDEVEAELAAKGVTPEQLKWRRLKVEDKGKDDFDQEYPSDSETCFLVSGRGFFDAEALKRLHDASADAKPVDVRSHARIRIYQPPDRTRRSRYLVILDPAEGDGGDPSGGIVYDIDTGEHVATLDGQFTPHLLAEAGAELARTYNDAKLVVERNNHGHAVLLALSLPPRGQCEGRLYSNVYVHDDDKEGFPTTPVTRPQVLDGFEDAVRHGHWKSPDRAVLAQLRTFVVKNGKPQAAAGTHYDLVMGAAIGWHVRQQQPARIKKPSTEAASLSRFGGARGYG
jgi:hypothetical protein